MKSKERAEKFETKWIGFECVRVITFSASEELLLKCFALYAETASYVNGVGKSIIYSQKAATVSHRTQQINSVD